LRSRWLLSSVAISAVCAGAASAQVSVPLPGGRAPSSAPPPPTSVPLRPVPSAGPETAIPLPTVGQPNVTTIPIGAHGRPDINPYERDIDMTVPLLYRGRSLGDLSVQLTHDDQFFVDTQSFLRLINPLLNVPARAGIAQRLQSHQTFTAEDLAATGVSLDYDPASLAIVVLAIEPAKRAMERLFTTPPKTMKSPICSPHDSRVILTSMSSRIISGRAAITGHQP
jgi:outer membrane usher protein